MPMPSLAEATLSEAERRVVDRAVAELQDRFGDDLRSVWLYGSRARGERPDPESDVDLLVVLEQGTWRDGADARRIVARAAEAEGASPAYFSTMTYDVERLIQRREIRSFFIQEVDRDKIVLYGEP
jgi:predicted nucleotidyltransferase